MRKLVLCALVACKWTEFDDLSNEAPAHSTTKPDVKSSDWGVALASAQTSGSGANVLVIGTDPPTFSTIVHDADGNTHLGSNAIDLNVEFAISSIPDPPILLDDPNSDAVALVIPTLDGRTLVEGGTANMPTQLGVIIDPGPLAAAYLPQMSAMSDIVVVGKGTQSGTATISNMHVLDIAANTTATCTANDVDGSALSPIAMIAAPMFGANGTVLAWTATGQLVAYDQSAIISTCTSSQNTVSPVQPPEWGTTMAIDTGFVPVEGEIAIADHFAVLAGHGDPTKGDKGEVVIIDLDTGMQVTGSPLEADGVRGFAVGQLGDKTYLALGFPANTANPSDGGAGVPAGTVEIRELDTTSGAPGATIALQLSDAQPDTNEKFGRSIAIVNFGTADGTESPILVVGASNELFSYYKTSLYDIGLK